MPNHSEGAQAALSVIYIYYRLFFKFFPVSLSFLTPVPLTKDLIILTPLVLPFNKSPNKQDHHHKKVVGH